MSDEKEKFLIEEAYLDLNLFPDFPTKVNYRSIFEDVATGRIRGEDKRRLYRSLCLNDLYFLMRYAMDIDVLDREFAYRAALIAQTEYDGYLHLWARGHFKSTYLTRGRTIQEHLRNRDITVAIFSHTKAIAKGFHLAVKEEYRVNSFLRALFPDIIPSPDDTKRLNDERIELLGRKNRVEPSLSYSGVVDGQPTSRHYDLLVYDDVVTLESVGTKDQIEKTLRSWQTSLNLRSMRSRVVMVGTRYHLLDLYGYIIKNNLFKIRTIPCYDASGVPVLKTEAELEYDRQLMGSSVFSCQMLLDPVDPENKRFDETLVRFGTIPDELRAKASSIQRFLITDPAITEKRSADWLVIMYLEIWTIHGLPYVQVVEYYSTQEGDKNPTTVVNRIIDMKIRYNVVRPVIEVNAYQLALKHRYVEVAGERGVSPAVEEYRSSKSKDLRISAIQPILEGGRFYCLEKHKELLSEMQFYPKYHDDHLDPVGIAIELSRTYGGRIAPGEYGTSEQNMNGVDYDPDMRYAYERQQAEYRRRHEAHRQCNREAGIGSGFQRIQRPVGSGFRKRRA